MLGPAFVGSVGFLRDLALDVVVEEDREIS